MAYILIVILPILLVVYWLLNKRFKIYDDMFLLKDNINKLNIETIKQLESKIDVYEKYINKQKMIENPLNIIFSNHENSTKRLVNEIINNESKNIKIHEILTELLHRRN